MLQLDFFASKGVAMTLQRPRTADMLGKLGLALTVSAGASSIRFGLGHFEDEPILFDLAAASLTDSRIAGWIRNRAS